MDKLPSKEVAAIKREMTRMTRNFNGIADMGTLPAAMFVVDVNHEKIAVAEGNRCEIATVGLVDTNSDPTQLKFPIPGNDDAVKSIRIIVESVVAAIQAGLAQRDSRRNAPRGQQAEAPAAAPASGDVDLSKVVLPAGVEAVVEGDAEAVAATAKKKPVRARRAPVKAE
jgi:small subunit ribosomal protein S2